MTRGSDTLVPPKPSLFRDSGYDPEYKRSGAWRTMPYHLWLQERAEEAGLNGRTFVQGRDAPERRPNGTLDGGGSHIAGRDEIAARFTELGRMIAGMPGEPEDPAKARAKAYIAEQGALARRAAAGDGEAMEQAVRNSLMQLRAVDPVVSNVSTPIDFAAQFGTPLDTTELITLCDETGLLRALPDISGDLKTELWREMTSLDFISGSHTVAFAAGECPEEYQHNGENKSVDLKHAGAKKSLTESDILHSRGSIRAGYGITDLLGPFNDGGLPGENDVASMVRSNISDLKEKEMALMSILVLNGLDQELVFGDEGTYPLEFDGITEQIIAANGARANEGTSTGTFNVTHFNQFLAAGCARPDAILGHPVVLADIALSYMEIGSQTIFYDRNERITPGINFAGEILTSYGPVSLIADANFPVTDNGDGTVTSVAYPVKLRHNGEPLIYKRTQIPLAFKDLAPGCTAISFEIYTVTALIVKAMCAQARYSAIFSGLVQNGCVYVDPASS